MIYCLKCGIKIFFKKVVSNYIENKCYTCFKKLVVLWYLWTFTTEFWNYSDKIENFSLLYFFILHTIYFETNATQLLKKWDSISFMAGGWHKTLQSPLQENQRTTTYFNLNKHIYKNQQFMKWACILYYKCKFIL